MSAYASATRPDARRAIPVGHCADRGQHVSRGQLRVEHRENLAASCPSVISAVIACTYRRRRAFVVRSQSPVRWCHTRKDTLTSRTSSGTTRRAWQ
jgi:hypothetical protein